MHSDATASGNSEKNAQKAPLVVLSMRSDEALEIGQTGGLAETGLRPG